MDASSEVVDVPVVDASGEVVDVSGGTVDVSGGELVDVSSGTVDVSGGTVDVSGGELVDVSSGTVDVSGGEVVDASGGTVDVSGGEVVDVSSATVDASGETISLSDLPQYTPPPPAPPPTITLADILAATEVVTQKETEDRSRLESIGTISFDALRTTLIQWAKAGFPNATPIYAVAITPPDTCSDGVKRSLADYLVYLTGKTIAELIVPLQARCPEFVISYATTGPEILVVVSKA